MEKVEFDYSKLRGLIVEKFGTNSALAEKIGLDKAKLSQKLNSVYPFSQTEIYNICLALGIDGKEKNCQEYFFSRKC